MLPVVETCECPNAPETATISTPPFMSKLAFKCLSECMSQNFKLFFVQKSLNHLYGVLILYNFSQRTKLKLLNYKIFPTKL